MIDVDRLYLYDQLGFLGRFIGLINNYYFFFMRFFYLYVNIDLWLGMEMNLFEKKNFWFFQFVCVCNRNY